MRLDIGNELAHKEIAIAHASVGGIDVEGASSFSGDDQEIGNLALLAEVLNYIPAAGLEQSLFVVAEAVEKIEDRITSGGMSRRSRRHNLDGSMTQ